MDLIVSAAVLIPRPETEHLVETVIELVKPERTVEASTQKDQGLKSHVRIVDVGTGSGCIALALAKELPHAEIHATDISAAALEIARANAARHQLDERIHFHSTDLLGGLEPEFDIVVSNPPYVGESEEDQVQFEVRKFEPRSAVFGGPSGTEIIERLIPQAWHVLRPGSWLVLEISGRILNPVLNLLRTWREVHVMDDLQSIPRVVRARKPC